MEELIQNTICLFDSLAVAGYGTMTAMVYLSAVVPSLKDLASHGKTRENEKPGATAANTKGSLDFLMHSDLFLVKKKRFRQFYFLGLLCLTATLWLATKMRSSSAASLQVASIALLYLHLFRRLYECTFVHKWKDTSQMHIAGYLVGAIHYMWLPMVFIRLPCEPCLRAMVGDRMPSAWYSQYTDGPLWVEDVRLPPLMWRLPPILLCLWGQYQQHVHHVLLANTRKPESSATTKDKPTTKYSLPTGGWFQYVTCPHYLAEILVYVSFTILLAQEQVQGGRHFLVLFWVASNLTLSALINFKWYKENLPIEAMKGRKAIIPFLL
jgi:3-oxo-5-alpha-steroid 4-dehydrogenase 3 / polyprenol reductase